MKRTLREITEIVLEAIEEYERCGTDKEAKKKKRDEIANKYGLWKGKLTEWIGIYHKHGNLEELLGHDATPTWSGYLYQGHVALYVALKHINESDLCLSSDLEIEWIEDFSLKNNYEDNYYYSLHQVKARKGCNSSDYTTAIDSIKKLIDQYKVENYPKGYLHLIKKVQFKDELSDDISVFKYQIGEEEKTYCDLEKIEKLIDDEIQKYYYKYNIEIYPDDIMNIRLQLNHKIDELVRKRHQYIVDDRVDENEKKNLRTISLCELCKLISSKIIKQKDWDMYLRKLFEKKYQSYREDLNEIYEIEENEKKNKLLSKANKLNDFIEQFRHSDMYCNRIKDFCVGISPHHLKDKDIRVYYNNLLQLDSLKNVFFDIVTKTLEHNIEIDANARFKLQGTNYMITTINEEIEADTKKRLLIEKIYSNIDNAGNLYNVDSLISNKVNITKEETLNWRSKFMNRYSHKIGLDDKEVVEKHFMDVKSLEIIDKRSLFERIEDYAKNNKENI
ncbi:ABC-three component system protein [Sporosalibacterium faouarense]|uniref:ABC-three component system protein n=1 Tax=Sporosalibacterium faouarense TaxID=516123 RepID=UPI00192CD02F|nr:ABC-three component system protein [Sporosalibacterium faouarense]